MRLTPRTLLLLAIGDPAILVGVLALSGVLHLPTLVGVVVTVSGIALNGLAIMQIINVLRAQWGS